MGVPSAHRTPKEIPARRLANPTCGILLEASENPNIALNSGFRKVGKEMRWPLRNFFCSGIP